MAAALVGQLGQSFNFGPGLLAAGLGIGVALGKVTVDKIKEIFDHNKFQNTLDSHTVRKKHLFDEFCGPDCINEAEKNIIQVLDDETGIYKDGVGHIHFLGKCHHGCTIRIKLTLPKCKQFWDISTAHHVGPCFAKKNLFKINE